MKKLNILLVLGLALLLMSCATVKPSEVKGATKVVEVPGASKDEIFVRAASWMAETFNSSKSVTQYSDKEAGIIKGKYVIDFPQLTAQGLCDATITIECKDEKCRLIIDDPYDFRVRDAYSTSIVNMTQKGFDTVVENISFLCESFEKSVKEKQETSW